MVAATPRPENSSYHPFVRRPSDDPVGAGRDALDRHAWNEAYGILTEADRAGSLGGEGLWLLASAAYWTAHPDETVEALERAFGAYLKEGDRASAAMMAFRVAEQHGMRMAMPQAMGWAARAQRLGEENPTWPVHAWLAWMNGLLAWFQRDFDAAVARYDEALERASRSGDRNLYWMSIHDKGHALCLLGKVDEGMTLLDEAMAAVVGGELDPEPAGYVYCGMIGACSKLGDYGRASEWTEATLRWCERQSVPAFPGVCRIHKAELMRLHGWLVPRATGPGESGDGCCRDQTGPGRRQRQPLPSAQAPGRSGRDRPGRGRPGNRVIGGR